MDQCGDWRKGTDPPLNKAVFLLMELPNEYGLKFMPVLARFCGKHFLYDGQVWSMTQTSHIVIGEFWWAPRGDGLALDIPEWRNVEERYAAELA